MTYPKPHITRFVFFDKALIIDWDIMACAFSITAPDGGATILIPPPPGSSNPGVQAGIDAPLIRQFFLRTDTQTGNDRSGT